DQQAGKACEQPDADIAGERPRIAPNLDRADRGPIAADRECKGLGEEEASEDGRRVAGRRTPLDERAAVVVENAQASDAGNVGQRFQPLARRLWIVEDERWLDTISAELRCELDIAVGMAAHRGDAREENGNPRQRDGEQGDAEMKSRQQFLEGGVPRSPVGHDPPPSARPMRSTRGSTRSGPRPIASRLTEKLSPAGLRARQNIAPLRQP